jgi:hypothetical protein
MLSNLGQTDTQEKNIQVPMMTAIHTTATFVITYMGSDMQDSEGAIEVSKQLWENRG